MLRVTNMKIHVLRKSAFSEKNRGQRCLLPVSFFRHYCPVIIFLLLCFVCNHCAAVTGNGNIFLERYRNLPEVKQIILVEQSAAAPSEGTLFLFVKKTPEGEWQETLRCNAFLGKNGINKTQEGDKKTPSGDFGLLRAFGVKDDPGSLIPYTKLTGSMYLCGDREYYNQFIDVSRMDHRCSGNSEHLIRYVPQYNYGLFLDYNKEGVYGKGSAIFLHCFGSYPYTMGCISVAEENMVKILQTVDQNARICIYSNESAGFVVLTDVVPEVETEMRYYTLYNFVGDRICGYEEPVAFVTKETAAALQRVVAELAPLGYTLKVFDAYRPQMAVDHFVRWASDHKDVRMKWYFYPEEEKETLFAHGYISARSGHSRGSTVDLTLYDIQNDCDVDMGGTFDYFGYCSHADYPHLTEQQKKNRQLLQQVMRKCGFRGINTEWWHFTLQNEPYPDRYFNFPVRRL